MKYIKLLTDEVQNTINRNYKKSNNKTVRQRYKGMSEGFDRLIKIAENYFHEKAHKYYIKRSKHDDKLEKIQEKAIKELRCTLKNDECLKNLNFVIIPMSSFSAKTNLVGESDIDVGILIKNIDEDKAVCIANILGRIKYILSDIRQKDKASKKHWVFQKFFQKVEIECKVRDKDGFAEMIKMHRYTDNKMKRNTKIYSTYIKYLLKKNNKKVYENFKMIYYCNAGYHGGSNELLYNLL